MITLIDIQVGNIGSVCRALDFLKIPYEITSDPSQVAQAKKLIFPGVGSFAEASRRLTTTHMREAISEAVLNKKVPILGICLGMQLLLEKGFEGEESDGLGFVKGEIRFLRCNRDHYKIPHMGWNDVRHNNTKLFSNIPQGADFYFVHSYEALIKDNSVSISYTNYDLDVVAAFEKDNIYGVQFHPEKSQKNGLELLKNYASIC